MLTGDTYFFLYSLPVVMTCTLVASVIVSFTFMPLIAYYLIKAPKHPEPPISERRQHGFPGSTIGSATLPWRIDGPLPSAH